ncbi:MAG: exodeoxyribonuclease VII large subunit [bacterium]|nr:exodeoxyribonuclease VII large subunit [bacterium]
MSEEINGKKIFSLLEVTNSIKKTIADRYKSSFWVKAEMNKLNYFPKSGHCYPDLVEKQDGKVIAQIRCNLWKDDYIKINSTFQRVLKEPLKDGIKILFLATISFHPEHGLALRIIDIDPSFTLGNLEKEKQEAIKKLQDEGIFRQNKTLKLPLLTQRIAIISVNTSKGYQDFLGKIENNSWGYKFFHMLFPSILQGDKMAEQMTTQLKLIKKVRTQFDAVAIIRGGGGDVGLSSFNSYELAKIIALFPLPVLSGIGHITNDTVVEMVSHKSFITPTDLANFLFQEFHNFSVPVQKAQETIIDKSRRLISDEKTKFHSEVKLFRSLTENILIKSRNSIKEQVQSLFQQSQFLFKNEKEYLYSIREGIRKGTNTFCISAKQEIKQFALTMKKDVASQLNHYKLIVNQNAQQVVQGSRVLLQTRRERVFQIREKCSDKTLLLLKNSYLKLNSIEKNVTNMSPKNVMKRGYSITLLNGKAVKNFDKVKVGDNIDTLLFEGKLNSIIKATTKTEEL